MNEKIEWEYQLNIYAWLIEKVKKIPVHDLGIVAILRDWKQREVGTKENYPEAPIKELPIVIIGISASRSIFKNKLNR